MGKRGRPPRPFTSDYGIVSYLVDQYRLLCLQCGRDAEVRWTPRQVALWALRRPRCDRCGGSMVVDDRESVWVFSADDAHTKEPVLVDTITKTEVRVPEGIAGATAEAEPVVAAPPSRVGGAKGAVRLPEAREREIVQRWNEGESGDVLRHDYFINNATLGRILREAGIDTKSTGQKKARRRLIEQRRASEARGSGELGRDLPHGGRLTVIRASADVVPQELVGVRGGELSDTAEAKQPAVNGVLEWDGLQREKDELAAELRAIDDLLREHEKLQRFYGPGDTLLERTRQVIGHYRDGTARTIQCAEQFRDDLMLQLRAFSMVVDMTGSGATHAEKAARLRGLSELIEGSLAKLREMRFDDMDVWHWPDVFRSDFPTRTYVQRIHELEAQVRELQMPDLDLTHEAA